MLGKTTKKITELIINVMNDEKLLIVIDEIFSPSSDN